MQQRIDNTSDARKHFEKAISIEPEVADHRNSYGVFLCESGELTAAQSEFDKAATNPFYKTPEYALDNAGLCLLDAGDTGGAETYLRDALRRNPRFAPALLHMADLLFQEQRLTLANAYFGRYSEYGKPSPASLSLGLQIRRELGDKSGAKQLADRLLNDFPDSSEAGEYLLRPL